MIHFCIRSLLLNACQIWEQVAMAQELMDTRTQYFLHTADKEFRQGTVVEG